MTGCVRFKYPLVKVSDVVYQLIEFYKNLDKDFKVEETYWNFGGLINFIGKNNVDLQTKISVANSN